MNKYLHTKYLDPENSGETSKETNKVEQKADIDVAAVVERTLISAKKKIDAVDPKAAAAFDKVFVKKFFQKDNMTFKEAIKANEKDLDESVEAQKAIGILFEELEAVLSQDPKFSKKEIQDMKVSVQYKLGKKGGKADTILKNAKEGLAFKEQKEGKYDNGNQVLEVAKKLVGWTPEASELEVAKTLKNINVHDTVQLFHNIKEGDDKFGSITKTFESFTQELFMTPQKGKKELVEFFLSEGQAGLKSLLTKMPKKDEIHKVVGDYHKMEQTVALFRSLSPEERESLADLLPKDVKAEDFLKEKEKQMREMKDVMDMYEIFGDLKTEDGALIASLTKAMDAAKGHDYAYNFAMLTINLVKTGAFLAGPVKNAFDFFAQASKYGFHEAIQAVIGNKITSQGLIDMLKQHAGSSAEVQKFVNEVTVWLARTDVGMKLFGLIAKMFVNVPKETLPAFEATLKLINDTSNAQETPIQTQESINKTTQEQEKRIAFIPELALDRIQDKYYELQKLNALDQEKGFLARKNKELVFKQAIVGNLVEELVTKLGGKADNQKQKFSRAMADKYKGEENMMEYVYKETIAALGVKGEGSASEQVLKLAKEKNLDVETLARDRLNTVITQAGSSFTSEKQKNVLEQYNKTFTLNDADVKDEYFLRNNKNENLGRDVMLDEKIGNIEATVEKDVADFKNEYESLLKNILPNGELQNTLAQLKILKSPELTKNMDTKVLHDMLLTNAENMRQIFINTDKNAPQFKKTQEAFASLDNKMKILSLSGKDYKVMDQARSTINFLQGVDTMIPSERGHFIVAFNELRKKDIFRMVGAWISLMNNVAVSIGGVNWMEKLFPQETKPQKVETVVLDRKQYDALPDQRKAHVDMILSRVETGGTDRVIPEKYRLVLASLSETELIALNKVPTEALKALVIQNRMNQSTLKILSSYAGIGLSSQMEMTQRLQKYIPTYYSDFGSYMGYGYGGTFEIIKTYFPDGKAADMYGFFTRYPEAYGLVKTSMDLNMPLHDFMMGLRTMDEALLLKEVNGKYIYDMINMKEFMVPTEISAIASQNFGTVLSVKEGRTIWEAGGEYLGTLEDITKEMTWRASLINTQLVGKVSVAAYVPNALSESSVALSHLSRISASLVLQKNMVFKGFDLLGSQLGKKPAADVSVKSVPVSTEKGAVALNDAQWSAVKRMHRSLNDAMKSQFEIGKRVEYIEALLKDKEQVSSLLEKHKDAIDKNMQRDGKDTTREADRVRELRYILESQEKDSFRTAYIAQVEEINKSLKAEIDKLQVAPSLAVDLEDLLLIKPGIGTLVKKNVSTAKQNRISNESNF
ncbi:MAG: hypothetical protein ACK4NC_02125 [Candidatus Gracilibacteria bacterium]